MNLEVLRTKLLKNKISNAILKACSGLYGIAVSVNLLLYKLKIRKQKKIDGFVVCIGNITAGGTGKTPTVLLCARMLSEMDIRTAVISRGYKRPQKGQDIVVLYGQNNLDWQNAGDEPYMLNLLLKDKQVPVIVGKSRYKAAKYAREKFASQVILLDDGFQHHKLKRDRNVVLIDAKNPFGGGLLPYGNLREPLTALERADIVLLTHSDMVDADKLATLRKEIRHYNPALPIVNAVHKPKKFFNLINKEDVPLETLKGPAVCFCGLGDPASFESTLKNLGLTLKQTWRYADHQKYTLKDIETLENLRGKYPLITTFKDYVKLPEGWQNIIQNNFYMLEIEMSLDEEGIEDLKQVITP